MEYFRKILEVLVLHGKLGAVGSQCLCGTRGPTPEASVWGARTDVGQEGPCTGPSSVPTTTEPSRKVGVGAGGPGPAVSPRVPT